MRCLRPTGRAAMDTEESGTEVTDEELIAVDVVQVRLIDSAIKGVKKLFDCIND